LTVILNASIVNEYHIITIRALTLLFDI